MKEESAQERVQQAMSTDQQANEEEQEDTVGTPTEERAGDNKAE